MNNYLANKRFVVGDFMPLQRYQKMRSRKFFLVSVILSNSTYDILLSCMEKRKKRNYKAKQQKKIAQTILTVSREIPLTETDRITYVYARDKTEDAIREIINVSYDAWIEKSWLTILRYDSTHGYLHQHTRFSLTQEKEFISKEHIPQEGSHQEWLT